MLIFTGNPGTVTNGTGMYSGATGQFVSAKEIRNTNQFPGRRGEDPHSLTGEAKTNARGPSASGRAPRPALERISLQRRLACNSSSTFPRALAPRVPGPAVAGGVADPGRRGHRHPARPLQWPGPSAPWRRSQVPRPPRRTSAMTAAPRGASGLINAPAPTADIGGRLKPSRASSTKRRSIRVRTDPGCRSQGARSAGRASLSKGNPGVLPLGLAKRLAKSPNAKRRVQPSSP